MGGGGLIFVFIFSIFVGMGDWGKRISCLAPSMDFRTSAGGDPHQHQTPARPHVTEGVDERRRDLLAIPSRLFANLSLICLSLASTSSSFIFTIFTHKPAFTLYIHPSIRFLPFFVARPISLLQPLLLPHKRQ
mmetsp:Transcript_48248/g.95206  ORF Transcript_48248/g.95206 Transcript_48248/m.95206 type:complete len:133 (-) Transcript_48248:534-932(-)